MTDRYNSLTVVLDKDIRDDDAESLLNAIRHFKGVLSVDGNISSPSDYMAEERAKDKYRRKILEIVS